MASSTQFPAQRRTPSSRQASRTACLPCRAAHIRCDGNQCLERDRRCVYKPSQRGRPHPKQDSIQGQQEDWLGYPDGLLPDGHFFDQFVPLDDPSYALLPIIADDLDRAQVSNSPYSFDTFFQDTFATPSYPRGPAIDETSSSPSTLSGILANQDSRLVRACRSDSDVIESYYIWIHPTFPILPPPVNVPIQDRTIPWEWTSEHEFPPGYEPSSPLILAIYSVLMLIPYPGITNAPDSSNLALRRRLARSIATCAVESIEIGLEKSINNPSPSTRKGIEPFERSSVHPNVPIELESIIALSILSTYEYLQHGNVPKMCDFANDAMAAAKKMSLHLETPKKDRFSEARRRAWWMTYMCMCNSSIVSCLRSPEYLNDISITSQYPSISSCPEAWKLYIKAEKLLLSATFFLVGLLKGIRGKSSLAFMCKSMRILHDLIEEQMACFNKEDCELQRELSVDPSEELVACCMKKIAWVRLNSSKIKIHRYCAFFDSMDFLKKLELPPGQSRPTCGSSDLGGSLPAIDFPASNMQNGATHIFPFAIEESLNICLASAKSIACCLSTLPRPNQACPYGLSAISNIHESSPRTLSPFACSAIQCGYTFMMLHHKASNGRWDKNEEARTRDAYIITHSNEALILVIGVLEDYSLTFESMREMKVQLEKSMDAYLC